MWLNCIHYAEKKVVTKMEEVQISSKIKEESSISTHYKAPLQSTPASTTMSDHTEQLKAPLQSTPVSTDHTEQFKASLQSTPASITMSAHTEQFKAPLQSTPVSTTMSDHTEQFKAPLQSTPASTTMSDHTEQFKAPLQSTLASTTMSDHTEQLNQLSLKVQDEYDKDTIKEDHLEVKNDAYNKERETILDLVSAISEKISSLMVAMNDNPDLKKGSKELEQLKTLQDLSLKLSVATNQLLEKEFTYCGVTDDVTYKPMVEEQQHRPHKTVSGQICPPESFPHYPYQAPPTGYGSTTMNANLGNMKFRKVLLQISNQLSGQDLHYIKFMCEDDVPRSKMERVRSGTDLFNMLEERGKLSSKNLGFLVQVLIAVN